MNTKLGLGRFMLGITAVMLIVKFMMIAGISLTTFLLFMFSIICIVDSVRMNEEEEQHG